MKHLLLLLFCILTFASCKKEKFDEYNPKNGQVIEIFADHYQTGTDARLFTGPDKQRHLSSNVENFPYREMGYTYLILAKVVVPESPVMDGPSYWFSFIKTSRREKYTGKDTFALPLLSFNFPGPYFSLKKEANLFYYSTLGSTHPLVPANADILSELEAVYATRTAVLDGQDRTVRNIYVQHDPANYTNGYIVYKVDK